MASASSAAAASAPAAAAASEESFLAYMNSKIEAIGFTPGDFINTKKFLNAVKKIPTVFALVMGDGKVTSSLRADVKVHLTAYHIVYSSYSVLFLRIMIHIVWSPLLCLLCGILLSLVSTFLSPTTLYTSSCQPLFCAWPSVAMSFARHHDMSPSILLSCPPPDFQFMILAFLVSFLPCCLSAPHPATSLFVWPCSAFCSGSRCAIIFWFYFIPLYFPFLSTVLVYSYPILFYFLLASAILMFYILGFRILLGFHPVLSVWFIGHVWSVKYACKCDSKRFHCLPPRPPRRRRRARRPLFTCIGTCIMSTVYINTHRHVENLCAFNIGVACVYLSFRAISTRWSKFSRPTATAFHLWTGAHIQVKQYQNHPKLSFSGWSGTLLFSLGNLFIAPEKL